MQGSLDWPVLYLIVGVAGVAAGFGWWLSGQLGKNRHDMANLMHLEMARLEEDANRRIALLEQDFRRLSERIDKIGIPRQR